jgi:hypothetical protein
VNGDASIRPWRIGKSSCSRVCSSSSSRATGSRRSAGAWKPACEERGASARAALPIAARSAFDGCWARCLVAVLMLWDEIPEASVLIVQAGADELHQFEPRVPRANAVPVSAI